VKKIKSISFFLIIIVISACTSTSNQVKTTNSKKELDLFSSSVDQLLTDQSFLKSEILKINASKSSIQRILNESDDYWLKGNLKKANSELERALRISKNESSVYLRLAHIRLEQGLNIESESFAARGLLISDVSSWERLLLNVYAKDK
jgi:Tfp pilus assembly protein PilF